MKVRRHVLLALVLGLLGIGTASGASVRDAAKLFEDQKLAEAERALVGILAKTPDEMDARLLLGWVLWKQDRWDEALLRFKSVVHDAPAQRLPTPEERDAFRLDFSVRYIDNPDLAQARKGLAWTYFKKGWLRLARAQFERLNALSAEWDEPYLGLGYVALGQGRFTDAEQAFTAYLRYTDNGTKRRHDGERALGDLHAARDEHAKAAQRYEAALALRPAWPEVQSSLAWAYLAASRPADARRLFAALGVTRPVEMEAGLAAVALRENRYDDAEAGLGRALAAMPGSASALRVSRELRARRYRSFDEAWKLYHAGAYAKALAAFDALIRDPGRLPASVTPFTLNGLAWAQLARGDVDTAEKTFRASLTAMPSGAEATAGLGWVALARKQLGAAEKAFGTANAAVPGLRAVAGGYAALYRARFGAYDRAWALYAEGKYAAALAAFEALQKAPGDFPASSLAFLRGAVGWVQLALGQVDAAEAAFRRIPPGSKADEAELKAGLGWVALKRNRLDDADRLFTEALAAAPAALAATRGVTELRRLRAPELDAAWVGYAQGKHADALAGFTRVADRAGVPAAYRREARRGAAWSRYVQQQYPAAAAGFDQLLSDAEDADLLYGRGLAAYRQNQHTAARGYFKKAIAAGPRVADYHLADGWAALRAGETREALAAFLGAYALAPASGEVNRSLGFAYAKANQPTLAKAAFRYAADLIPAATDDLEFRALVTTREYAELASALAWGYVRWHGFEQARGLFEARARADSADGDAWFGLGYALYKLGKSAEADKSLGRAVSAKRPAVARTVYVVFPGAGSFPILAEPRSIRGWNALVKNRCGDGLPWFDVSLERDPEMVASLVGRGTCLQRAGKLAEARELYLTAAEVYPTYPGVVAGLEETDPKRAPGAR